MTTNPSSHCYARKIAACLAFGGLLMTLQAPENAAAQEWRLEPEVRLGVEYDDNARLRSDETEQVEIEGFIVEGSAGIAYLTPRTTFRVIPRARSRVYDEAIDVDSNDQFLEVDWTHETLKGRFSINSDYSREAARTAERADADVDEDDPEEIPTDNTGIVFSNERRDRLRISPQWRQELTERLYLDTRYVYTDTSYDEDAFGPLRDYTDHRITAGLGNQFSERTRGYVSGTARRFDSDRGNDVDGVGVSAGVETDLSQTTRFQIEAGVENTDRSEGGSDSNVVGNVSVLRRLETVRLLAQYRRNISAGGAGRVTARDSLALSANKQFSERMSAGLGIRAYQTDGLGDEAVTFQERDYAELHAEFSYALTRTMLVEADYRHARLDRTGMEGRADGNSIILWLVYRPTPIVTSR
ncbi:MAG: hypothetical protein WD448_02685 [Woeseia sp.]